MHPDCRHMQLIGRFIGGFLGIVQRHPIFGDEFGDSLGRGIWNTIGRRIRGEQFRGIPGSVRVPSRIAGNL